MSDNTTIPMGKAIAIIVAIVLCAALVGIGIFFGITALGNRGSGTPSVIGASIIGRWELVSGISNSGVTEYLPDNEVFTKQFMSDGTLIITDHSGDEIVQYTAEDARLIVTAVDNRGRVETIIFDYQVSRTELRLTSVMGNETITLIFQRQ